MDIFILSSHPNSIILRRVHCIFEVKFSDVICIEAAIASLLLNAAHSNLTMLFIIPWPSFYCSDWLICLLTFWMSQGWWICVRLRRHDFSESHATKRAGYITNNVLVSRYALRIRCLAGYLETVRVTRYFGMVLDNHWRSLINSLIKVNGMIN